MPRKTKKYKIDVLPTWNTGTYINEADLIPNMSQHIAPHAPSAYNDYYNLTKEEKLEQAKISHNSIATKQSQQGDNVLSFVIAGSGSAQWNKVYKGFNGINEVFKKEVVHEVNTDKKDSKEIVNFVSQKYNTELDGDIMGDEDKLEEALQKEYGESQYVNSNGKVVSAGEPGSKLLSGFRVKKKGTHTKVNLSGPLGEVAGNENSAGASNSGEYSIEKLEAYMVAYADNWLREKRDELNTKGTIKPIHIHIKGHSRGGVAANEGATFINKLIEDKYPTLKRFVDFEVALYDPVPGTGSYTSHVTMNHNKKMVYTPNGIGKGLNSDPQMKNNVTVIYSLISNDDFSHNFFFTPQEVLGANRVIMTGMNHNVGIYDIEDNHHASFIYSGNGERYRGTGLSELPQGMFFLDENNVLAKVNSKEQAQKITESALSTQSRFRRFVQGIRTWIMDHVISRHFEHNPEIKEELKNNVAHNSRVAAQKGIMGAFRQLNDSDPMYPVSAGEKQLKEHIAKAMFYRSVELLSKTEGKELKVGDTSQQKLLENREKNMEAVMADPSFDLFFNSLKAEDIKALCEDYDGKNIDKMMKSYNAFREMPLEAQDKQYLSAIQRLDSVMKMDAGVYAQLLSEGYSIDRIMNPLALQSEKAAAFEAVNKLEISEYMTLISNAAQTTLDRLDSIFENNSLSAEDMLTADNAPYVATGKMLEGLSKTIIAYNPALSSQAKQMAKALDCILESKRNELAAVSMDNGPAKEVVLANVLEQKAFLTTVNELRQPDKKLSETLGANIEKKQSIEDPALKDGGKIV